MNREAIATAKELGRPIRLSRQKRRVCFHVLSVNLAIKYVDAMTSFAFPVSSRHLDWYFGQYAWNDWFFNEFLTKEELDPRRLTYCIGVRA